MNYLYLTFGSNAILSSLQAKHAQRHFLKLTSFENNQEYALLDITSQKSLFKSGVDFKIRTGKFEALPTAKYYFNYFMLDEQEQKKWLGTTLLKPEQSKQYLFCQSLKHDFNFLTITTWEKHADYLSWVDKHPFLSNSNGTFNASYKRIFTLTIN